MIKAFCASMNVDILCLPPHSSHLLQPLDRLYFSRLKQFYAQLCIGKNLLATSRTLLNIVVASEQARSLYMIVQSWAMTGLRPSVEDREVSRVSVEP